MRKERRRRITVSIKIDFIEIVHEIVGCIQLAQTADCCGYCDDNSTEGTEKRREFAEQLSGYKLLRKACPP
jgi:hypothetical protein